MKTLKIGDVSKPKCSTCFGSGKVTIYENAGFKYKGLPYKIKCPSCK